MELTQPLLSTIGLFILLAGFVVGLGAVTVIDFHGFLGRKSAYWTEATTRTHKVTKPLIWLGLSLIMIGGAIHYRTWGIRFPVTVHLLTLPIALGVGYFLSFKVSPFLLKREKEGRSAELLPSKWQTGITVAFLLSFTCWWGNLLLIVWGLTQMR